jgi:cbb3-type cytochrome oxidase maturation protein
MEHAMNVLVYLVPMALALGLIGLFAFLWSLKSGQYDDLEGAALRVLLDDDQESDAREPEKAEPTVAHS